MARKHYKWVQYGIIDEAVLNSILNWIFISLYDISGAAIASKVSVVSINIWWKIFVIISIKKVK